MAGINLKTFGLKPFTPPAEAPNAPATDTAKPTQPVAEPAPLASVPPSNAVVPATPGIKLGSLRLGGPKPAVPALAAAVPARVPDESPAPEYPVGSTEGFQAKLDRLDALVGSDIGVNSLTLDTTRAYVGAIMKELKANPELDPLLKDRDMHNIMAFIQGSTTQASKEISTKKEKASNKIAKAPNTKFNLDGFGDINITPKTAIENAVSQAGLADFSKLDVDSIETKLSPTRRK